MGGGGRGRYGYARLARDLEEVLDALELGRAALAGASMGAHTILRFALDHPERVAALGLVTPAFDPARTPMAPPRAPPRRVTRPDGALVTPEGDRDALAQALREGGVEEFVRAYDFSTVPPAWRETVERVVRSGSPLHEHPAAVADAMEVVSRSRPFEDFAELAAIAVPTVVVASPRRGRPRPPARAGRALRAGDPRGHAHRRGGRAAAAFPDRVAGGQLSKVLLELLAAGRSGVIHGRGATAGCRDRCPSGGVRPSGRVRYT